MRISWLEPETARRVRDVLIAWHADMDVHFDPEFRVPPTPPGIPEETWPRLAEHVARAERVAQMVRDHGPDQARERFQGSGHAIELATLLAAAMQVERADMDLVDAFFSCPVDDLVMYGPFLELLQTLTRDDPEAHDRALGLYERFAEESLALDDPSPMWREWSRSVRDGLAAWYVRAGRLDQAEALFQERHQAQSQEIIVALTASRVLLAAGHRQRAGHWLGVAAARARDLGRDDMAAKLEAKRDRILGA